jgi:hypothetical protein
MQKKIDTPNFNIEEESNQRDLNTVDLASHLSEENSYPFPKSQFFTSSDSKIIGSEGIGNNEHITPQKQTINLITTPQSIEKIIPETQLVTIPESTIEESTIEIIEPSNETRYIKREKQYRTDYGPTNLYFTSNLKQRGTNDGSVKQNDTNEDEKIIEKLIGEYYSYYSDSYQICNCQSCSQLLLPFLVLKTVSNNEEELIDIHKGHSDYLSKCQNEGKIDVNIQKGIFKKKLNNCYCKTVWLGELIFKWNSNP